MACQCLQQIDSLNSELVGERQRRDASTLEHYTAASGSVLKPVEAGGHSRRLKFTTPVGPDRLSSLLGKTQAMGGCNPPSAYVPQSGYVSSKESGSGRSLQTAKEQEEETLRDRLKQVTLHLHHVARHCHICDSCRQYHIAVLHHPLSSAGLLTVLRMWCC